MSTANTTESATAAPAKYTIQGKCHCGAIKSKVDNINPKSSGKCNCSICNITGFIANHTGNEDIKVYMPDGSEKIVTDENSKGIVPGLASYSMNPPTEDHYSARHFCEKCGVHVFLIAYIKAFGGPFYCVNMRTLDLAAVGIDIKDISGPGAVGYFENLKGTYATSKEEPFPGGAW